ncbi:MAG: hypothetical protein HY791_18625 [Deltaproteobacteria bacterium]|nr:hypothetical protein [Deltaproteobacteria bacterium]
MGQLVFNFDFDPIESVGTSAEVTSGRLEVKLAGLTVWDTNWTWIELLEHLARYWQFLIWEESLPSDLELEPFATLEERARRRFARLPDSTADEISFDEFRRTHDLSRALQGAWLSSLWIVRHGDGFRVSTSTVDATLSFQELLDELERVATKILERLRSHSDRRVELVRELWNSRKGWSAKEIVSVATGLSVELISSIAGGDLESFWELDREHERSSELMVAARMTGHLSSPELVRRVQVAMSRIGHLEAPELERLSASYDASPSFEGTAYEDGYRSHSGCEGRSVWAPAKSAQSVCWKHGASP